MNKNRLLGIVTFGLLGAAVLVVPVCLVHDRSARHNAQERTAALIRDHHCRLLDTNPDKTEWSTYDGKFVTIPGNKIWRCDDINQTILIGNNEVQP